MISTTSSGISYKMGDIYTLYAGADGMLLCINGTFTIGKMKSHLSRNFFFLTDPHYDFRDVGQCMK